MANEIRASDVEATCLALLDEVADATCLALLDEVADRRAEFVITKRGRPVARLIPIDEPADMRGSDRLSSVDDDLFSTGEVRTAAT